ncbi:MAG: heavy metal sensor histidine kinase [Pseudomonadota bacterium]|nr:heavy metal sensor histidine kinase [Pseudomonadota bacterium]
MALTAVMLFAGVIYWRLSAIFDAEHQQVLQAKVAELQVDLDDADGDPRALVDEIIRETGGSRLREYQARVLTADGRTLGESPGMGRDLPRSVFPAYTGKMRSTLLPVREVGGRRFALTTVLLQGPGGGKARVQYALDVTRDTALQADFRRVLALAFLLLIPLLILAGRWVASRGLAPLTRITDAAQSITPADLSARLTSTAPWPQELRELVGVFNAMLARLEEAFARLSRFSADIAHELRTPLGHLRGELEVCLMRPRSVEDYRGAIESGLDECRRLTVLIENLLFTARAEHAGQALHRECFDAAQACAWSIEQQAARAAERALVVTLHGDATLDADPILFRQALTNVLVNAIRHASVGSEIEVRLTTTPDHIEIRVHNAGETIAEKHLPHLFDRFYQVDAARRRDAGRGTGLGLSIVAAIMELHGGTVRIESTSAAGTTVIMRFPQSASSTPRTRSNEVRHET